MVTFHLIEFEGHEPFSLKTDYKKMTKRVISLVEDFAEIDRKYINSIKETTKEEAEKFPIVTVLKGK